MNQMDLRQRERAEFYARLASIPSLTGLPLSEALRLQEEMERVGFPWLRKISSVRKRLEKANVTLPADAGDEELRRFKQTFRAVAFHEIHRYAHDIINGLLDDGKFDWSSYRPLPKTVIRLDKEAYKATEEVKEPDPQDEMILDLLDLVRQPNFPFRKCPACNVVFVPVKNQRYCSPTCTYKVTEQGRKKQKATYMRGYMRRRRRNLEAAG
jgi:hypothetical protein